jgi:S-DNA-T family DNA segregation ATPase FtsK/SpoIIIE
MPSWMVLAGLVLRGLWALLWFCAHRPVRTAGVFGGLWPYATYGGRVLDVASACAVAVAGVLLVAIWWLRPAAYSRYVVLPLLGRWRRWWVYGRRWPDALRVCELHKTADGDALVPRLRRVVCTPSTDRLVVRVLMGLSPEHFRRRSAELAYTFGARHAQVVERRPDTPPSHPALPRPHGRRTPRAARCAACCRRHRARSGHPLEPDTVVGEPQCAAEAGRPLQGVGQLPSRTEAGA